MRLSRHFVQNWQERVGGPCSKAVVHRLLAEAIRVQAGMCVLSMDGTWVRIPSIYWHPGRRLFIKMDPETNTCITVMTEWCI